MILQKNIQILITERNLSYYKNKDYDVHFEKVFELKLKLNVINAAMKKL